MLFLRNARVFDPSQKLDKILDIFIKDGKIADIGKNLKISCENEIDITGKLVTPGLIDMHTHFREPGFEVRETINSGANAAAKGALTAVCCMPNTDPPLDNTAAVKFYREKSRFCPVEIYPIACISKGRDGKELTEMVSLFEAGAVAFSDDGSPVWSSQLMRRALEYSKITGTVIIDHCEEKSLSQDAVINEGYMSTVLGLKGMPAEAETIQIYRDISLAAMTGGRIHIAHLSTKDGVELVRQAKKEGVNITCEATINHMLLTEDNLINYDTNLKVNPPLRTKKDALALMEGLADGTIDALVSDHAPWTYEEKEVEFDFAPFGISGVETLVPLAIGELYKKHKVPLEKIILALSYNPAKILNLPQRSIKKGSMANLSIIDLNAKYTIKKNEFISLGKNTPYDGKVVNCKPYMTIVNGKINKI